MKKILLAVQVLLILAKLFGLIHLTWFATLSIIIFIVALDVAQIIFLFITSIIYAIHETKKKD